MARYIADYPGADPTGTTESTDAINAAISDAAASGEEVIIGPGLWTCGTISVISGMKLRGESSLKSIIKAKNGLNADLLSSGGAINRDDVHLESLRFDGNKANNTSGTTIQLHGHRPTLKDLVIVNSAEDAIITDYTLSDRLTGGLGYFERIVIDSPAESGWWFNGPNDSLFTGIEIIDAGVKTDNAEYGIYINSSARFTDIHHWNRNVTNNTAIAGVYVNTSGCNFANCHFEGGHSPLIINGNANTFSECHYYAPRGTYCVQMIGVGNKLSGLMGGGYASANPNYGGVLLTGFCNDIDIIESNCNLGTVNFASTYGRNRVRILGYKNVAPAYLGTIHASDDVVINMMGPGGAVVRHAYP
jgi:hypothetical protein